jgi:hypothetical protein
MYSVESHEQHLTGFYEQYPRYKQYQVLRTVPHPYIKQAYEQYLPVTDSHFLFSFSPPPSIRRKKTPVLCTEPTSYYGFSIYNIYLDA